MTQQSRPMRVLVIDDDPMSRDLLRVLLQAEGYEVECADSGEDAITWIHHTATAPGLVLADVQMPASPAPGWPANSAASAPGDPPAADERKPPARPDSRALRRISAEALHNEGCHSHAGGAKSFLQREKKLWSDESNGPSSAAPPAVPLQLQIGLDRRLF